MDDIILKCAACIALAAICVTILIKVKDETFKFISVIMAVAAILGIVFNYH